MMMTMTMMMNCFCWMVDRQKGFTPCFQPGPLLGILTMANLRYAATRAWTYAESEFRLCRMKMCSSDNHCTICIHITKHQCRLPNISAFNHMGINIGLLYTNCLIQREVNWLIWGRGHYLILSHSFRDIIWEKLLIEALK